MGKSGMTLIEVMIGSALGILVVGGVGLLLTRSGRHYNATQARASADQEQAEIVAMLTHDIDFIDATISPVIASNGASVTIQTKPQNPAGADIQIMYTSSCIQSPSILNQLNFATNATFGCLPNNACEAGEMPVLTVTRPPPQTTKTFPLFIATGIPSNGSMQGSIGAMGCFSVANNRLNVQLANFYVSEASSASTQSSSILSAKRSLSLPITNPANVQILRGN